MTDRLAAMRAQRQGGGQQMSSVPQPAQTESYPMNTYSSNGTTLGGGGDGGMASFYDEVASIQDAIKQFDQNVARISDLHSRTLSALDERAQHQNSIALDEAVAETRTLQNSIRARIKALSAAPAPQHEAAQRKTRTKFLQEKFIASLQNYQRVEAQYRDQTKERVKRQFKIVKPNATEEEVQAVANDDGHAGQIFSQAISTSNQYGESRAVYNDVQKRHQDIRKIEETFAELAQLINDMSILVQQQEETIDNVEKTAQNVAMDTEAGLGHTNTAVKHARNARRGRWICFGITVAVLVIVAIIIVAWYFTSGPGAHKN